MIIARDLLFGRGVGGSVMGKIGGCGGKKGLDVVEQFQRGLVRIRPPSLTPQKNRQRMCVRDFPTQRKERPRTAGSIRREKEILAKILF